MATDDFNPYHAWLGLDRQCPRPSYYQLLGIAETERDPQRIAAAADWAATRVRNCIPGPYATLWTAVLDEISAAKRCLSDLAQRAIYDRQLQEQRVASAPPAQWPAPRPAAPVAPPAALWPPAPAPRPSGPPLGMPPPPPVPAYPQTPAGPPAPMAPYGSAPAAPYPTPLMPPTGPFGAAPAASYPGTAPTFPPAPGYMLPPAPGAMPPRTPFSMPPAAAPWPAASAAPVYRPQPGLGPPAPAAPVAAAPVANAAAATTAESELAAATAPTAKRRAAAIKAKKDESRSKLFALLVTLSGVAVLLVAVAILALLAMRSDDKRKNHARAGGDRPVTQPAPTTPAKASKTGTPDQGPPKPGTTTKRPLPGKPDRRFSVPTSGEWPHWPGKNDSTDKTAKEDPIPPLRGIDELAPKLDEGMSRPKSSPDGTRPEADEPLPKLEVDLDKPEPTRPGPAADPDKLSPAKREPLDPDTAKSMPGAGKPEDGPPQPTAAQVRALAKSLKTAREALGDYRFDRAKSELEKVKDLPMLPAHREKYQRLDVLTQHAEKFRTALSDAVKGLTVGANIRMASGIELGVVNAAKDTLTVRVAGQNKTYRLNELPLPLALAIADQFIDQKGDSSPAFKAAFVATHKNVTEEQLAKAREWWKSAKTDGGQVANLDQVFDDQYDLETGAQK